MSLFAAGQIPFKHIYSSPYLLKSKVAPNSKVVSLSRAGVLLKVVFEQDAVGYSDLHAWPELGEATLDRHLGSLKKCDFTDLCLQSISAAGVFALLKNKNIRLSSTPNHKLLSNFLSDDLKGVQKSMLAASEQGFQKFKVKIGRHKDLELLRLRELSTLELGAPFQWRLDFNVAWPLKELTSFLSALSDNVLDRIDFLEDPLPSYEESGWLQVKNDFALRLAADRARPKNWECFDVLVLKAAIENPQPIVDLAHQNMKRVVLTSNMAHPLGLLHDLVWASNLQSAHPLLLDEGGLMTQDIYQDETFAKDFRANGNVLNFNSSQVAHWAQLLEQRPWTQIL